MDDERHVARRRFAALVLSAVVPLVAGCAERPSGVAGGPSAGATATATGVRVTPDALWAGHACAEHFAHVVLARWWNVGSLRRLAPDPMPDRALSRYPASTPVALCLVERGAARFDAVAVLPTEGGRKYLRWTQTVSTHFAPPV